MYDETRTWIAQHWDESLTLREWWARMLEARLSFPRWPVEWFGRACSQSEQNAIAKAFGDADVLSAPTGLGVLMGAPVTMAYGTDEQKRRWLPSLADGTEGWCQLFSEPGAGGGIRVSAGAQAGLLDRTVGDLAREARAAKSYPDEHGGLVSTLTSIPAAANPTAPQRQRLTDLAINERIADITRLRVAAAAKAGKAPGAEASTMKLHWTNGLKVSRDLGMELLGANGMLVGADVPAEGTVQHFFLTMPSASIAGGSDEVQHNIIGERALGLPKDVQPDPNTPFREIPRN